MMAKVLTVLFVFCISTETSGWFFKKKNDTVCYGTLGCFSSKHPFTNTDGLLPHSPEVIGTKFFLFTNSSIDNYEELIMTDNQRRCSWKSFCTSNQIIMIIHGYLDHVGKPWVQRMVKEFLKKDSYNIIFVDWRNGARQINYQQSAANIRVVGAQVAQLLKVFKNVYDIDASNVHIIGHSLGAHAAGYAGEYLENIGRITGLDPAGPSFEGEDIRVRLDHTDATFVDVIHTDSEGLHQLGFGTKQPSGTVDFYPNGGMDQEGCPNSFMSQLLLMFDTEVDYNDIVDVLACNHLRALDYFTESINSNCTFTAYPCTSIANMTSSQCNTCDETGCGVMGYHSNSSLKPGLYFLSTNADEPFCISENELNEQ
ncbi:hypothetical protein ACF0H5_005131 [Mactra antiquata]